MSRSPIPKLCHHKASGRAVVCLGGRDHYLGPWGSEVAQAEYDRLIAEWLANGRRAASDDEGGITVTEIAASFWEHAQAYYRHPDGTPTHEAEGYRDALRPILRLFGHVPARKVGPLALKAVRQAMIDVDLCRTQINRRVGRIKHVFKWAVENELVPPSVYHGLQAVAGLKAGRSAARESEPVKAVPDERVDAVISVLSPSLSTLIELQNSPGSFTTDHGREQMQHLALSTRQESSIAAMIQLQRLTGMRSGEVTTMRTFDIDCTGRLWIYRPGQHKTQHHGHVREIYLGPRAQVLLQPFLKHDLQAFLFSPAENMANHRRRQSESRTTPRNCGNVPGSNRKRKPRKVPTDRYHTTSYGRAVTRACEIAFSMPSELRTVNSERPKPDDSRNSLAQKADCRMNKAAKRREWHRNWCWHPHQLRHTAATRLRKEFGLEAAQVVLGHRTVTVTQIYAERNLSAAQEVMAKVG